MQLTKEEIQVLMQVLNMPRQQDLQSAGFCIQLNNKLAQMIDELDSKQEDMGCKKPKK